MIIGFFLLKKKKNVATGEGNEDKRRLLGMFTKRGGCFQVAHIKIVTKMNCPPYQFPACSTRLLLKHSLQKP